MIKPLERVIAEIAKLPEDEQADLAEWILEELDERRWQKKFAETKDALRHAAAKAIADDEAGLTEEFDPDDL